MEFVGAGIDTIIVCDSKDSHHYSKRATIKRRGIWERGKIQLKEKRIELTNLLQIECKSRVNLKQIATIQNEIKSLENSTGRVLLSDFINHIQHITISKSFWISRYERIWSCCCAIPSRSGSCMTDYIYRLRFVLFLAIVIIWYCLDHHHLSCISDIARFYAFSYLPHYLHLVTITCHCDSVQPMYSGTYRDIYSTICTVTWNTYISTS